MIYSVVPLTAEETGKHAALAAQSPIAEFLQPRTAQVADGFHYATIEDYHRAFLAHTTTPTEVAKRFLDYLQDDKDNLNAIPHLNASDVLDQAAESTKRYQAGTPLGIFDGILIPVKACINVRGFPLTSGTKFYSKIRDPAQDDTPPVRRLRDAGAIIVGGVNMHEIGMGTSGFNAHFGPARNPHNRNHFTGGSSSGSGALVAAGIVPVSIGLQEALNSVVFVSKISGFFRVRQWWLDSNSKLAEWRLRLEANL